jgi:hypothetical protein
MSCFRVALACALASTAVGAQGEIQKPGAMVAERVQAVFDSLPSTLVARQNSMNQIWAPLGLRGMNYYVYAGIESAGNYAARSDPKSPLYQAWVGAYVVEGGRAQFGSTDTLKNLDFAVQLGEHDQRSWLAAMGDPSPLATARKPITTDTITLAGATRVLYRMDMDSHSDLSMGNTPLAKTLGMPPASEWQPMLASFHPLTLHTYFSFWRDESRDVSIVVYAVSAAFKPTTGPARDNGPAIDALLRDTMRKVRFVYTPTSN